MSEFREGTAVVIGGSGGVGRAIAERFATAGSPVALTYRRNEAAAREVVDAIAAAGGAATMHPVKLADEGSVDAVFAAIEGPIHSVVYAAGPSIPMRWISEVDGAAWRDAMETDVQGFFHVVRASLPRLREIGGSLTVISTAGLRRYVARDVLSVAPKAAVEALTRGVAREEGRFGVRANMVALGVIEAGMFLRLHGEDFDARWVDAAKANTALKRFGTAEEVAEVVAFLASPRASYVTGQVITMDGGYSI